MFKWTPEQLLRIFLANSTRELLTRALEERKAVGRPLSFAEVSRRAGFATRSYPRDVVHGTRGLSLESARAFAKALALPTDVSRYLLSLLDAERSSGVAELAKRAQADRERGIRKLRKAPLPLLKPNAFRHPEFSRIYASLGSPERGATIAEIAKRAKLRETAVTEALRELEVAGFIEVLGERWRAKERVLFYELLAHDGYFARLFLSRLAAAQRLARKHFDRPDMLFAEATFSVSSGDLPRLKARLRQVMVDFIDSSELAEGDEIASVVMSFFPVAVDARKDGASN